MTENATLSADQVRSLRCLAEMIIPASTAYSVPSAGDDAIFADILRSFGRDAMHVHTVMRDLEVRPPFPKGFEVEQGDWSLLDPVRARPKLYPEVP